MTTEAFIDALEGELGEPYVFGGDSPAEGFDCSGLVYYCAGLAGYFVPRTSEEQWAELPHVVSPLPGDLIFFDVPADDQAQPAHVAVYLAPNLMIEAPRTGEDVKLSAIPNVTGVEAVMGFARIPFPVANAAGPSPSPESQEVYMIPTGCTDQGAVRAQIREWWGIFRTDPLTEEAQNLELLAFGLPVSLKGFGGSPDLLEANIIDTAGAHARLPGAV